MAAWSLEDSEYDTFLMWKESGGIYSLSLICYSYNDVLRNHIDNIALTTDASTPTFLAWHPDEPLKNHISTVNSDGKILYMYVS